MLFLKRVKTRHILISTSLVSLFYASKIYSEVQYPLSIYRKLLPPYIDLIILENSFKNLDKKQQSSLIEDLYRYIARSIELSPELFLADPELVQLFYIGFKRVCDIPTCKENSKVTLDYIKLLDNLTHTQYCTDLLLEMYPQIVKMTTCKLLLDGVPLKKGPANVDIRLIKHITFTLFGIMQRFQKNPIANPILEKIGYYSDIRQKSIEPLKTHYNISGTINLLMISTVCFGVSTYILRLRGKYNPHSKFFSHFLIMAITLEGCNYLHSYWESFASYYLPHRGISETIRKDSPYAALFAELMILMKVSNFKRYKGAFPSMMLFFVAYQFFSRSSESFMAPVFKRLVQMILTLVQ